MQINSVSASQIAPVVRTKSNQVDNSTSESTDRAELNFSPDSFSSLVKEAGDMPDVRSEVVDAYKARISSGSYPSQETIAGLADTIGSSIVAAAKSGS